MTVPLEVRLAYGLGPDEAELDVQHVPSNINATYIVRRRAIGHDPIVLQRLHPVFGPHVHVDIQAVTAHLMARGLETPHLIRNHHGELWTTIGGGPEAHVWRALSFVDGVTLHRTRDTAWHESAASLLGRFQRALVDLKHEFVHERPLHDTRRHLANLETALGSERARDDAPAQALGAEILRHAEAVRVDFASLPKRIIHGDPKLSNVMFAHHPPAHARCMIDLDTVGRGYVAYELGDALRSWCNPAGEDTPDAELDAAIFTAVMRGYARTCPAGITRPELLSAIDGFETVSVELASRYAADVIVDRYWGWDPTRFTSRREHNVVRARGQLALSRAVRAARARLDEIATAALEAATTADPRSA
jgi:Ser/Thr protein kinase RdoA (MazF antagonist)